MDSSKVTWFSKIARAATAALVFVVVLLFAAGFIYVVTDLLRSPIENLIERLPDRFPAKEHLINIAAGITLLGLAGTVGLKAAGSIWRKLEPPRASADAEQDGQGRNPGAVFSVSVTDQGSVGSVIQAGGDVAVGDDRAHVTRPRGVAEESHHERS